MLNLFLSSIINSTQVQFVAQAATVYLPVATKQSRNQNCVTYVTTNSTTRRVSDIQVNLRNSRGEISKRYLASTLSAGRSISFDLCNNSFVNVEARQD